LIRKASRVAPDYWAQRIPMPQGGLTITVGGPKAKRDLARNLSGKCPGKEIKDLTPAKGSQERGLLEK